MCVGLVILRKNYGFLDQSGLPNLPPLFDVVHLQLLSNFSSIVSCSLTSSICSEANTLRKKVLSSSFFEKFYGRLLFPSISEFGTIM